MCQPSMQVLVITDHLHTDHLHADHLLTDHLHTDHLVSDQPADVSFELSEAKAVPAPPTCARNATNTNCRRARDAFRLPSMLCLLYYK